MEEGTSVIENEDKMCDEMSRPMHHCNCGVLLFIYFPSDGRVCTCLSRAILSHSRSCLLALSCRSSFLICSTCQAESRHRHRYSLNTPWWQLLADTQSRSWTETTKSCSARQIKMLKNTRINYLKGQTGFSCLTAFHFLSKLWYNLCTKKTTQTDSFQIIKVCAFRR